MAHRVGVVGLTVACSACGAVGIISGGIQQLNCLLLIVQGQWGVTAAEEEEENRRIREFQDSIPKMCSQLRILTHFYQVRIKYKPRCPLPWLHLLSDD